MFEAPEEGLAIDVAEPMFVKLTLSDELWKTYVKDVEFVQL